MRTQHIHQQLKSFGFVKCTNPAHNSRGYTIKHQKAIAQIDIFFNSFELLDEAAKILEAQGVKVKQCRRDIANGCWLSIEQSSNHCSITASATRCIILEGTLMPIMYLPILSLIVA